MKPGEQFESEALKYLKNTYSNNCIDYKLRNTADSTMSDIEVYLNGSLSFFIEVKDSSAQSGQFVLLADEEKKKFVFSPRNKSTANEITELMVAYMNNDFDRFYSAGTSGASLDIDNTIFSSWIKNYYKAKKVSFVISRLNKSFVILPLEKIDEYFDISAKYRIKKSGSSSPSQKYIQDIKKAFRKLYPSIQYKCENKKLYASIAEKLTVEKLFLDKYYYLLAKKDDGSYEIRQLSNTNNMNVIFSLKIKKEQAIEDLLLFKTAINI